MGEEVGGQGGLGWTEAGERLGVGLRGEWDFGCVQGGDWWGRQLGLGPVRIGYEAKTGGWPYLTPPTPHIPRAARPARMKSQPPPIKLSSWTRSTTMNRSRSGSRWARSRLTSCPSSRDAWWSTRCGSEVGWAPRNREEDMGWGTGLGVAHSSWEGTEAPSPMCNGNKNNYSIS